jgi:transcriptional regulator with XRE-family HTH domain
MKRVDLSLASRFKLFRELLGFSQKEFADKLGVSQKAISQWERGERAIPAVILKELKEHLNLNIDWLLTGEGEPFITHSAEPVKKKTPQVV